MKLKWQSLWLWGLLGGIILPWSLGAAVFQNWEKGSWGSFSQGFFFDFHSITKSRFYQDGDLFYEFANDRERSGEEVIGQNLIFESRSAYYYRYLTGLFIYTYGDHEVRYFNYLQIEDNERLQKRGLHTIMPQVYFTIEPFRFGVSYYQEFSATPKAVDEQLYNLRGERALSLHAHLHIANIPKTPLGVAFLYEYAFDPGVFLGTGSPEIFQRMVFNLALNFTHYSQFNLSFSRASSTRDTVLNTTYPVAGGELMADGTYRLAEDNMVRYQLEYSFIYRFTNMFSINILMGHLLYANLEAPMYRFKIGATYHYGS